MVSASKSNIRSAARIVLANLVLSFLDSKGIPDRFKLALLNLSQSSRSLVTKFRKVRLVRLDLVTGMGRALLKRRIEK